MAVDNPEYVEFRLMLVGVGKFFGRQYNETQMKEIPSYIHRRILRDGMKIEMVGNLLREGRYLPTLGDIKKACDDVWAQMKPAEEVSWEEETLLPDCELCGVRGSFRIIRSPGDAPGTIICKCARGDRILASLPKGMNVAQHRTADHNLPGWSEFQLLLHGPWPGICYDDYTGLWRAYETTDPFGGAL